MQADQLAVHTGSCATNSCPSRFWDSLFALIRSLSRPSEAAAYRFAVPFFAFPYFIRSNVFCRISTSLALLSFVRVDSIHFCSSAFLVGRSIS